MVKLTKNAETALMKATKNHFGFFEINRTLGYATWATKGEKGKRSDIAELYKKGLIVEWFNPWVPPCVLTKKGESAFFARQKPKQKP
jgi:hypothetical protein